MVSNWDNWLAVANMDINTTLVNGNPTLLSYGPSTTTGTSTVGVNMTIGAGSTGVGAEFGAQWSYTVPDVTVDDRSNFAIKKLDIRHNIDEFKLKQNTIIVKPGKISSTSDVGNGIVYDEIDHYSINFYKDRTFISDQYKTFYADRPVIIHG